AETAGGAVLTDRTEHRGVRAGQDLRPDAVGIGLTGARRGETGTGARGRADAGWTARAGRTGFNRSPGAGNRPEPGPRARRGYAAVGLLRVGRAGIVDRHRRDLLGRRRGGYLRQRLRLTGREQKERGQA